MKYSTHSILGQVFSRETLRALPEAPWAVKKMRNELLAAAYEGLDMGKAERLRGCGDFLQFRIDDNGNRQLERLNSCRVRLCPLCAWRRSLKTYCQTDKIVRYLGEQREYRYILLTLTVRNCEAEDLSLTLDKIFAAYNRLLGYADIKRAVKGWSRSLEVTYNNNPGSPAYGTYHPHLHVLLCVYPSYYKRYYISHRRFVEFWRRAARLDYDPDVDVRNVSVDCSRGLAGAVAEIAKYTVKDADYIYPDDWELTQDVVATLDSALAHRRLVAFGGVMRDAHKLLNLDDVDDGDYVHVDNQDFSVLDYKVVSYFWFSGARNYYTLEG